ncbi:MAG: hypothetical protein V8S96_02115 [Lachnospiraceae bacterium]
MVIKEKLAALSMCYSITVMEYHGREYCISASEERDGGIVMIDTETKTVSELEGLAGGVMAVIPIPEREGEFLSIQKFYPIFDSRKSTGGSLPHLGGNIPEDAGRGIGGSGYSVCTPDRTCPERPGRERSSLRPSAGTRRFWMTGPSQVGIQYDLDERISRLWASHP